ncbi:hypothetical protein F7725_013293 [Dissostichus mawsoni]|uniref:Uncharacterized protein n=1 Tax=Dissostichus mawsoni TaxID=36200 RepID=A0A7J5YRH4_DISMA|nr:hypothetical protein F7725_013293 [Dissostichus mawsoni]
METIEYDSKFQLQAKEDAVKYKQKLFAEELFSQSLQIQSLQSENKILKATIEEDKDVLKENEGILRNFLTRKNLGTKKIETQRQRQKSKSCSNQLSPKTPNLRNIKRTHCKANKQYLGEKNEKQDKILQEKLQECKADVLKETNKVIQKEKELVNLKDGMAAEIKTVQNLRD